MLDFTQNLLHSWINVLPASQNNRMWHIICEKKTNSSSKTYIYVIRRLWVNQSSLSFMIIYSSFVFTSTNYLDKIYFVVQKSWIESLIPNWKGIPQAYYLFKIKCVFLMSLLSTLNRYLVRVALLEL